MRSRRPSALARPLFLAAFGIVSVPPTTGQAPVSTDTVDLLAELITVEDGLPQGMVQCVLQDRAGFMWFGTRGGLARSDGYGFTIYQHDDKDSTSIGSNIIRCMMEDSAGFLWLGMESGGLDRYDPRTERFDHILRDPDIAHSQWPEIRSIGMDSERNMWICSVHRGLRVVRAGNDVARPVVDVASSAFPSVHWPERINGSGVSRNGMLWIAFGDSLVMFDPVTERFNGHQLSPYAHREVWKPGSMYEFTPAGTGNAMWLKLDPEFHHISGTKDDAPGRFDIHDGIPGHCIVGMQDHFWVAQDQTNCRIRLADGRLERIRFKEIHGKRVKPEMSVICWMEDRAGTIWAGTNGYGVFKVTRIRQRFHHLPDVATIYRCSSTGALSLTQVNDDHWTNATGRIVHGVLFKSLHAHGLQMNPNLWTLDAQGRGWLSTAPIWGMKPRLTRVDNTGTLTYPDLIPDGLGSRSVYPGLGDGVWVFATEDTIGWEVLTALIFIDTRAQRVERRYPFPDEQRLWNDISSFEIAPDSTVWLVSIHGLYHLDPVTGAWEHFQHHDNDPRSLPTDRLISVCFDPEDPGHVLWVGTGGAGLVKFHLRNGVLERYTTKEGLPSNVVYGVLPDERHNLWFSTDMGLCRFDPRTKELKRFTFEDGLMGNEFNTRGFGATTDGRMFFAGPMGTTWFRPKEFYDTTAAAPTVLTGLRLTNRDVVAGAFTLPGEDAPLLSEAIGYAQSITVPFDERMITFTFACMDHTAAKANTFRYRLDGFTKEWIEAGTTHEATFTNLDPGSYAFRVQGRTSDGVWDEQGASIGLIVTPPWWATWWFRSLAVVFVIAALYAFYRYRVAQVLKLARMRDRIARDLHDEIGSTLSSVALFSEVAMRESAVAGGARSAMLTRISQSTSQMMESMNDIVWAVNSKHDRLVHVAQRMQEFAGRLAEAGGFALEFRSEASAVDVPLSMVQRKNLYLIFKEAVTNAAKYAQCRTLVVHLHRDQSNFVLRVQDDGTGFAQVGNAPERPRGGGNGLGNMRARADEMGGALHMRSAPGTGTMVELRFKP